MKSNLHDMISGIICVDSLSFMDQVLPVMSAVTESQLKSHITQ